MQAFQLVALQERNARNKSTKARSKSKTQEEKQGNDPFPKQTKDTVLKRVISFTLILTFSTRKS